MWANNYEEILMNWGNEDVEENLEECLDAYCDLDTHFEAIKMIEADFYRDDGKDYCSSLVALGYDGVVIKKDFNNTFHAVIWNPKIIKSSCYAINESVKLNEKYETAKNEKFVKEILNDDGLKKELSKEDSPDNILTILNKNFVGHDIYFSSDEIWGHYWTFGDVGIQLGCIYEDGSICIVCDPQYLIDSVFYEGSYKYYDFVSAVSSIISHELIHLSQMDSTPYEYRITKEDLKKDRSNFDYLSNKKEIDAHAKEAVIELINIGYSKEKILSWLGNNKDIKTHAVDSTALWKYYDYFGSYMGHEDTDKSDILTWKRFLSRMHDFCVKE